MGDNNFLIEVLGLSKSFKRYSRIGHRLMEWLPGGRKLHTSYRVFENISFAVQSGEAIGIIGRNGAGKSTLLKLLTGTLLPSTGRVILRGRVTALLELGMGFHPDFSGWDNAIMAGQLQGMSREEIYNGMQEIIDFAEIGDYIYQPVKTYSSGMLVRLAFSVATVIRPDILIVDEALAVGDAYFQHKCYRRIRQFKEQGVTLLFVSHDPLAIKSLCDRALLIGGGGILLDADPITVLDYYNALIAAEEDSCLIRRLTREEGGMRSGSGLVKVANVSIFKGNVNCLNFLEGDSISVHVLVSVFAAVDDWAIGIMFKDRLGNDIFGVNTSQLGVSLIGEVGDEILLKIDIDDFHLAPGSYSLTVACHSGDSHLAGNFDWWDQVLTVNIGQGPRAPFSGVTRLPVAVRVESRRKL